MKMLKTTSMLAIGLACFSNICFGAHLLLGNSLDSQTGVYLIINAGTALIGYITKESYGNL
jgi:hypothetical protein